MPIEIERLADTQLLCTRHFAAPPAFIYRAHVEEDLVKKWMLGPPGWHMPECKWDAQPGGTFLLKWAHPEEGEFIQTGEFIAFEPDRRIEHVERYHLPDPTPDNHIVTEFHANNGGTKMTLLMTLPSAEVIDEMLATGMADGMEASYARIETEL